MQTGRHIHKVAGTARIHTQTGLDRQTIRHTDRHTYSTLSLSFPISLSLSVFPSPPHSLSDTSVCMLALQISPGIFWQGDRKSLHTLVFRGPPGDVSKEQQAGGSFGQSSKGLFLIGYAGWSPMQLDMEYGE